MRNVLTGLGLMAACCVLFTGCEQPQKAATAQEHEVSAAIQTDCIVHYYKSNGSAYITRQQHGYGPQSGLLTAVSKEPTGKVKCSLLKDDFVYSEQKRQESETLSDLPKKFWSQNLAASVFYGFCAGGNLMDLSLMTAKDNVKIEGQWYRSYVPSWPSQFEITIYQSLDTNRVELIGMKDAQEGLSWLLRCYNFRFSKELEKTLPRTIDVLNVSDGIASKALMIRFEYKDIRRVETQVSEI